MTRTLAQRFVLGAAVALALAPGLSFAQQYPSAANPSNGASPRDVTPVARPNAAYSEVTLSVSSGSWTLASAAAPGRQKLILGDAVGLSCLWSTASSPAAGQGVPWSAASPNSYAFNDPAPTNAIYVKCTTAGTITVVTS